MMTILPSWQRALTGVDWATVLISAVLAAVAVGKLAELQLVKPPESRPAPYIALDFNPQFAGATGVMPVASAGVAPPPYGPVDPRSTPPGWAA